jgi:hypothetical protein
MSRLIAKAETLLSLVKEGQTHEVSRWLAHWFYSTSYGVGLYRDLAVPYHPPRARIPITVRPIKEGEIGPALNLDEPGISSEENYVRRNVMEFYNYKLPTCYVALTEDNQVCFVQWLILPNENERIQSYFQGFFPRLKPGEVLLENGFTPARFRGMGIMGQALADITLKATAFGARRALTFVSEKNRAALKGVTKAGFVPYLRRQEIWRFFRCHVTFRSITQDLSHPRRESEKFTMSA